MLFITIFGQPHGFEEQRQHFVTYRPARCAWCRGSGRNPFFFLLACGVCGGGGSALVAQPRCRCAFCHGSGREAGIFKCRACHGVGWAHAQTH